LTEAHPEHVAGCLLENAAAPTEVRQRGIFHHGLHSTYSRALTARAIKLNHRKKNKNPVQRREYLKPINVTIYASGKLGFSTG